MAILASDVQLANIVPPLQGRARILPSRLEIFLGLNQPASTLLALPARIEMRRDEFARKEPIAQFLFQRFVTEAQQERDGGWIAGIYAHIVRRIVLLIVLAAAIKPAPVQTAPTGSRLVGENYRAVTIAEAHEALEAFQKKHGVSPTQICIPAGERTELSGCEQLLSIPIITQRSCPVGRVHLSAAVIKAETTRNSVGGNCSVPIPGRMPSASIAPVISESTNAPAERKTLLGWALDTLSRIVKRGQS